MTTAPAKNSTWPPAPNVLKLANCDDVAQIWTWYQISGSLGELKMDKEIIQYIFHGLEGYLTQEGLSRPSDDDVLAWISTAAVRDFIDKLALGDSVINSSLGNIVLRSKTKCWLPVCRVQRWDGNPDIAGVGVRHTSNEHSFSISLTVTDACNIYPPDIPRHGLSHRTHNDALRLDSDQDAQPHSNEADLTCHTALNWSFSIGFIPVQHLNALCLAFV